MLLESQFFPVSLHNFDRYELPMQAIIASISPCFMDVWRRSVKFYDDLLMFLEHILWNGLLAVLFRLFCLLVPVSGLFDFLINLFRQRINDFILAVFGLEDVLQFLH